MYPTNMCKIFFLFLILANSIGLAQAYSNGIFRMQGSIVETACAIATDSNNQIIEFGTIPFSALNSNNRASNFPLVIHLIGCKLSSIDGKPWSSFDISFDGVSENGFFKLNGTASGISLSITDLNGKNIIPGEKYDYPVSKQGDNYLKYEMNLVRNDVHLRAGDFKAVIIYRINYN